MRRLTFAFLLLAGCASTTVPRPGASTPPSPRLTAALEQIRPEAIRGTIEFLASDLLEGRETGTRGYEVAAAYVASRFRELGLQPGMNGQWEQPFSLRAATLDRTRSSLTLSAQGVTTPLTLDTDFLMSADAAREDSTADGDVVFAGYGIVAPDLGRDDYSGIEAKGKIVVVLAGAPSSLENTRRAYYSDSSVKAATAAAHGAVGLIAIRTPSEQAKLPLPRMIEATKRAVMTWYTPEQGAFIAVPAIRASATLTGSGAARLFEHAPRSLEQIESDVRDNTLHAFDIPMHATLHRVSVGQNLSTHNVVGLLPGSDPKLRDEYLVVSAHLDHLGISGEGPDRIHNGALDNGSGIATILEVARVLAPLKPKRSVLFVAFSAEEKGELGSDYFARFPPVPSANLIADINIDMFQMIFPVGDMVSRGQEHSTLQGAVERAARELGIKLSPDPEPEQVRFVRSDQYSFVRQGIPAVIIKAGFESLDPSINGPERMKEWTQKVYHSPADDVKQPIDYDSGVRFARLNALLAWYVANDPSRVRWNEGDFFGSAFKR